METFQNEKQNARWSVSGTDAESMDKGLRAYIIGTYNWMASGLLVTAITAWFISNTSLSEVFYHIVRTPRGLATSPTLLGVLAMLSPLAFTLVMSLGWQRMSKTALSTLFWAFSACMGASMASLAEIYMGQSVAVAFLASTSMFAAASLWGYITGADLSRMGNILLMALIGMIVAGFANMFIGSSITSTLLSMLAVAVFAGLTAWDTQRLKTMWLGGWGGETGGKESLMAALGLYLNFVNMFTAILQLTGVRRD